jgi:hypothetical protein
MGMEQRMKTSLTRNELIVFALALVTLIALAIAPAVVSGQP